MAGEGGEASAALTGRVIVVVWDGMRPDFVTEDLTPNLWALALSHGLLSAMTAMSLPDWMLKGMTVGLRYLVYQAF